MATTTNYAGTLPTVGGDADAWGTINNTLHQLWDTTIKAVSDANAQATVSSGVVTSGASFTIAIPATGRHFELRIDDINVTANATLGMKLDFGAGVVSSGYSGGYLYWDLAGGSSLTGSSTANIPLTAQALATGAVNSSLFATIRAPVLADTSPVAVDWLAAYTNSAAYEGKTDGRSRYTGGTARLVNIQIALASGAFTKARWALHSSIGI